MTDAEVVALAAMVNMQTVLMNGDNKLREIQGYCPAYTMDCFTGEYYDLQHELERRRKEREPCQKLEM
jgi:hypothetical protein